MTDITDQELRDAIEWGRRNEYSGDPAEANAAIVILATVEPPALTLSEELQKWALTRLDEEPTYEELVDLHQDVVHFVARVKQMEHDLAEARAEVERLTAERQEETMRHVNEQYADLPVRDRDWFDRNGNPDPADVKPGEAWLVEVDGERRNAVKDRVPHLPWNTVGANSRFYEKGNEDVTLIARLVPAPRVITNPEDLELAKRGTVIRDAAGVVCERSPVSSEWFTPYCTSNQVPHIEFPATVLWEPEA